MSESRTADAGRRNAFVLTLCQGLFTCAISIDLTLTGLTGYQLAAGMTLWWVLAERQRAVAPVVS